MSFPLSSAGELRFATRHETDRSVLVQRVEKALLTAGARPVIVAADRIAFKPPVWRTFSPWSAVVGVSFGEITVRHEAHIDGIRYVVSHLRLLVVLTVLYAVWVGTLPYYARQIRPAALLAGWLWILACNYLLSRSAFRRLLRAAAERHPQGKTADDGAIRI